MKTSDITKQIIDAIRAAKVADAKTKPEKFVNVGVEAAGILLTENAHLIEAKIQEYADLVKAEAIEKVFTLFDQYSNGDFGMAVLFDKIKQL